jgi:cytochrome c553
MRYLIVAIIYFSMPFMTSAQTICEEGLSGFKKTLYPQLVKSCVECHGDNGIQTKHSASDPRVAYAAARGLVDFNQIQKSRFYTKVRNAHWLDYNENATGMTLSEMDQALAAWRDSGEAQCPEPFKMRSSQIPIPDLPDRASGNFKPLTWSMGECSVAVDVQIFSAEMGSVPTSYRLKNPRIKCPSGRHQIERVRFFVDDNTQAYENIYDSVSIELIHDNTYKILSDEFLIIIPPLNSKKVMAVGFGEYQLSRKALLNSYFDY